MKTIYIIIGFICFWGVLIFLLREIAIFLWTEKLWPSKFAGHLNFYVLQWIGLRIVWGMFKHNDYPISFGFFFAWPRSGFNSRTYKPAKPRIFWLYKKFRFSSDYKKSDWQ